MMSISENNLLQEETQNSSKYLEISVSKVGKLYPDMIRDIWHKYPFSSLNNWRYLVNTHNGKLKIKKIKKNNLER
ncbi:MAG: hypothetical protein EU529_14775 [Promethearchaeota archaeon]|nr:MAG: hypothetical protein EU529_14775 [Candidatus Lokiarchaeota archaeon]